MFCLLSQARVCGAGSCGEHSRLFSKRRLSCHAKSPQEWHGSRRCLGLRSGRNMHATPMPLVPFFTKPTPTLCQANVNAKLVCVADCDRLKSNGLIASVTEEDDS